MRRARAALLALASLLVVGGCSAPALRFQAASVSRLRIQWERDEKWTLEAVGQDLRFRTSDQDVVILDAGKLGGFEFWVCGDDWPHLKFDEGGECSWHDDEVSVVGEKTKLKDEGRWVFDTAGKVLRKPGS